MEGIEPPPFGFGIHRSATELHRHFIAASVLLLAELLPPHAISRKPRKWSRPFAHDARSKRAHPKGKRCVLGDDVVLSGMTLGVAVGENRAIPTITNIVVAERGHVARGGIGRQVVRAQDNVAASCAGVERETAVFSPARHWTVGHADEEPRRPIDAARHFLSTCTMHLGPLRQRFAKMKERMLKKKKRKRNKEKQCQESFAGARQRPLRSRRKREC